MNKNRRPRPKGGSRNGGGPKLWKAKRKEHMRIERLFEELEATRARDRNND